MSTSGLTPTERSLRASIAAHSRWAATPTAERRRQADRGHAALLAKFAAEVDPDGTKPGSTVERPVIMTMS